MEKEEPWPGTLLPAELPEIRVLTFGYDAYVVDLGGVVSKNLIANHAMNLITALASYREKDDTVRELYSRFPKKANMASRTGGQLCLCVTA